MNIATLSTNILKTVQGKTASSFQYGTQHTTKKGGTIEMFFVEDILTDKIIDIFTSLDRAVACCNQHEDSCVMDEKGNVLYMFALPF